VRLSGVDPSIIRELSGIYKPFVKAFKELISNSYDADATTITVFVARDFSSIEIWDDGIGLTPIEFHRDFARLGGSTAWQNQGVSPGGRRRIGYKGIGFLAVARYCSRMEVESISRRFHRDALRLSRGRRRSLNVLRALATVIPARIVHPRLKIERVQRITDSGTLSLRTGYDYLVRKGTIRLRSKRALVRGGVFDVRYSVDCRDLTLRAMLDFDYLLSLERRASLHLLENFCDVVVSTCQTRQAAGTRIKLTGLKDFVVRDLAASRHRGKGWNIASQSGREQFFWRLARAAPIEDAFPSTDLANALAKLRAIQEDPKLPRLLVRWREETPVEARRPICVPKAPGECGDVVVPIEIAEAGLRAIGYLIAQSDVVYPAELRGITVRVRNAPIGDPSFFGLERILAGARKAALSQISGEVMVLDGLDSTDAINPGRESFYEEHTHYSILRRALIGSEEALGGAVGQAMRLISDRSNVRSQVTQKILGARLRRRVLTSISSGVASFARSNAEVGHRIARFFTAPIAAKGLAGARDIPLRPVGRIAGFEIEEVPELPREFSIDFANRSVAIDFSRDIWSQCIYLDGRYYEVCFKQGLPNDPICEFDNIAGRIFVNWAHPAKLYMDENGFLRSAIVWRLAYHAAQDDADLMMSLALNLLAHRAE